MTTDQQRQELHVELKTTEVQMCNDAFLRHDYLAAQDKAQKLIRILQCLQTLDTSEQRLSPLCDPVPPSTSSTLAVPSANPCSIRVPSVAKKT
jgi:hypothetical protein